MTIFRRGSTYLVYFSPENGFTFDAESGAFSGTITDVKSFLGPAAREWQAVPDDSPIPDALRDRLVLRFPSPGA